MYYIMGKHSIHKEFDSIEFLGIYNPRRNKVYRCPVKNIPTDTIRYVENDIIKYQAEDKQQSSV